ncbi:MAG TPA: sensor domain-containing protein, partial [Acidimicrobiales bacterium]
MSAPPAAPGGDDSGTAVLDPGSTVTDVDLAAGQGAPSWWVMVLRAPLAPQTRRDYLYLLASAPLAFAAFVLLAMSVWVAVVLSVVLVGIPLLALVVLGAREYAAAPRALARSLLGEAVGTPRRRRPRSRRPLAWLRASFGDIDGWRAIAYIVVSFPVTVVGAYVTLVSTALALIAATYPVWWAAFGPTNTDAQGRARHSGVQFGEFYVDTVPRALALAAVGVVAVFALPWIARLFTTADRLLVRGLLGPTKLSERVDDLEVTRAHAVEDSAATLRRIERDLHDGTQARLVALAMHLDMAKETLAGGDPVGGSGGLDVARARELLDQAHRNATEAIAELREVTRSIHPPALDRGLDEALATLAARSGVPARV